MAVSHNSNNVFSNSNPETTSHQSVISAAPAAVAVRDLDQQAPLAQPVNGGDERNHSDQESYEDSNNIEDFEVRDRQNVDLEEAIDIVGHNQIA